MIRRIFIFTIVGLFNYVLLLGVNFSNKFIQDNDLMVYFHEKPKEEEVINPTEPKPAVINEWNGETKEAIGKKIEKYYKDTTLEGYGERVASSAINRNVDPYLIASIIYINSGCKDECQPIVRLCKNVGGTTGSPNCMGGKYTKYNKLEESFDDLVVYIRDKFINKDMDSPYKMYKSYGKDSAWAYKVDKYMKLIKKG
jgi:hypothetical protein